MDVLQQKAEALLKAAIYSCFKTRDIDELLELSTEDVYMVETADGEITSGKSALRARLHMWMKENPCAYNVETTVLSVRLIDDGLVSLVFALLGECALPRERAAHIDGHISLLMRKVGAELKVCSIHTAAIAKNLQTAEIDTFKAPRAREMQEKCDDVSIYESASPGGIFRVDVENDFRLIWGNDLYYKIHGYTKEEIKDKFDNRIECYTNAEDFANIKSVVGEALRCGKKHVAWEMRIDLGAETRWVIVSGSFVKTCDTTILYGFLTDCTTAKELECELKHREERYRIALSQVEVGVWEYDICNSRIIQTECAKAIYGMEDIIENVPESLIVSGSIHPDSVTDFQDAYNRIIEGEKEVECVVKRKTVTGEYRREMVYYTVLFDENNKPIRAIGVSTDITAQSEAEERYSQEVQYREATTPDMIASYRINISLNLVEDLREEGERRITHEYAYADLVQDVASTMVQQEDKMRFKNIFAHCNIMAAHENSTGIVSFEYRRADQQGKIAWVCATMNILKEPACGDIYGFMYIREIDSQKKIELSLIARAERDTITKLYNRETTQAMVDEALSRRESESEHALILIDIDNFKNVNDTYGVMCGDKILAEVGRVLSAGFAAYKVIGRVGGDNFALLMTDVVSTNWVQVQAADLCKKIAAISLQAMPDLQITTSIGIAFCEKADDRYSDLFKRADFAVYIAKQQGKNRYYVYSRDLVKREDEIMQNSCVAKDFLHKRCMMDEMNEITFVIDLHTFEILYMNRAGMEAFNVRLEDYVGKRCYQVVQGQKMPCEFCHTRALNADTFQTWDHFNIVTNKHYLIKDKLIMWNDREARIEILTDVTGCRFIDYSQEASNAKDVLLECIATLISAESGEAGVSKTIRKIGEHYGASRACIVENTEDGESAGFTYVWNASTAQATEDDEAMCRRESAMDKPKLITDVETELNHADLLYTELKAQGTSSLYSVPLMAGAKVIGYICAENISQNQGSLALLESAAYFIVSEITRRRMQEKQEFLSYHDAMTGARNRNSYIEFLSMKNQESFSSLGIAAADINGLSEINKKFGHDYGDYLIEFTVKTFVECFGADSVYRFGGDEFVIVAQDITRAAFSAKVEEAQARISSEYPEVVPIGYTWADKNINIEQMRNHADEILLTAKNEQFKNKANQSKHARSAMGSNLLKALEERRFMMYLQPKADVRSGEIRGAEALVRLNDPISGIVTPDKFISLFEEGNLISHIDFFILEEACKTLQEWGKNGVRLFPISVNFSRATLLQPNLVSHIVEITDKYSVPHHLIEIEITESLGAMESETVGEIGRSIRDKNFRIALDDFGSKFTSMSILSIMEFDTLKLDKSLLDNLVMSERNRSIFRRVIQICGDLGIESVAEGVETIEQLNILKEMNCTQAQGYFYNKAIPLLNFQKLYLEKFTPNNYKGKN